MKAMHLNADNINRWNPTQVLRCLRAVDGQSPLLREIIRNRYYWLEVTCWAIREAIERRGQVCEARAAGDLYEQPWPDCKPDRRAS